MWAEAQVAERGFWSSLWSDNHSLADSETRKQEFIIGQLQDTLGVDLETQLHGLRVLDVGCGPVSWLSRHGGGDGVDPIEYPPWVYQGYLEKGLTVFRVPVEDFNATPYDAILLYNCLQHVGNLQTVVAKCNELLKPGGKVYVAENLEVPRNEAHLHYLTRDLMDKLFARCGFKGRAEVKDARLPGLCETPQGWPLKLYLGVFTKDGQPKSAGKFRLHVLGLAHTQTTREYMPCAYTQKVLKMCHMMTARGHEVYHYGAEGSDPDCTEHITVISNAKQREVYGDYDWRSEFFKHDGKDGAYLHFDDNAIREIKHRWNTGDLLLISMGNYQYPIVAALNEWDASIEMGIGYSGVFTRRRVFESYAWMHYMMGLLQPRGPGEAACQPSWYDAVIPNYFDPADFEFSDKKGDYFLYMGRLIPLKGVHIAAQCCERIGAKLIVAGQGKLSDLGINSPNVEHIGTVGAEERSELMRHAKAIFVPTMYLGPFEGVAVEAMFCGTPAITTDWGVFNETVNHGVSGWRCRTMGDFMWAANHCDLDPYKIREWAVSHYSMDKIAPMYEEYFTKCLDVWGKGWYAEHPERTQLDWLRR